ncbi:3-hydroxyisobutyryl-CoA hydrolase [Microbacterium sp. 2FI]|uniref:3-hydroxyisobutyryl-CoA hydrolase n=1 Tax=Microbacterium sp. 2FI TaxID=2502193 RepID=UPI0010F5B345|nr:3-hydroxyisobutyryl-CoA hydrolase [Microbacterium sp. 2FI]
MVNLVQHGADELRVVHQGRVLHVRLARPARLNAITPAMIAGIGEALDLSEAHRSIEAVIISGEGDRGLSAGGDVRILWGMGEEDAREYWASEYRLNARLAAHPVPVVALMDGIVMGGGMGIAMHDAVRVVTERSVLAMPEVRIGLSPDVGGTFRLAHAPGAIGTHLALTGESIGAADAIYAGLADMAIPAARLPDFVADLERRGLAYAIGQHTVSPPPGGRLASARRWIDQCYVDDSASEVLDRLTHQDEPDAAAACAQIRRASPTAVSVALGAIRNSRDWRDLVQTLQQDLRTSMAMYLHGDLHEGIRAQVIEKDFDPRWSPRSIEDVDADTVRGMLLAG